MERKDLILRAYCAIAIAQREGWTNILPALEKLAWELNEIKDAPNLGVAEAKFSDAVTTKLKGFTVQ